MPALHRSAAHGFAANATGYERGRPDYPAALTTWMQSRLHLRDGTTAIDLGSGTGKLVPSIAATGARVIAVEPVAEMRARAIAAHPHLDIRPGQAEAMPIDSATADAILCGQSFHWFANAQAVNEIRRVLRPNGRLALIWNVRDESAPWVAAITALLTRYEGDEPRYASGAWRSALDAAGYHLVDHTMLPHRHDGPPERVILDRVLSISFIAALPTPQRDNVKAELQDIIDRTPELSRHPTVAFPYLTHMYAFA